MTPTETAARHTVADAPELVALIDDIEQYSAPLRSLPATGSPADVTASAPDPFYGWVALHPLSECADCDAPTNELTWDIDEEGTIHVDVSLGCRFFKELHTTDVEKAAALILDIASAGGDAAPALTIEAGRLRSAVALLAPA